MFFERTMSLLHLQVPLSQFKSLNLSTPFLHGTSAVSAKPSSSVSNQHHQRHTYLPPIRAMRSLQGRVICTANDKTVNVEVTRLAPHPKYKRRVRKKKKFQAHDPENQFQIGDVVQHEKCKPIQMVKQQQQRGLRELKKSHLLRTGSSNNGEAAFSYKVDPFSLEEGDYVVHKKVGIGRFISIRPSIPDDDTIPIDYVYIQYADGVAKLPVKQASRFLYRYTLPNESASPRGLGRLKDTSIWEKRMIKGKVAI